MGEKNEVVEVNILMEDYDRDKLLQMEKKKKSIQTMKRANNKMVKGR